MLPRRPSIEKSESTVDQDGTDGLYVTDLEFPSPPSRYSHLAVQPSPASPQQTPTEAGGRYYNIQTLTKSVVEDPNHTTTQSNQRYSSRRTIIGSDGPEVHVKEEDRVDILDRKWFSWTWRRWTFILGPAIAIVVMAIVLVVVFVTRIGKESANNTGAPEVPSNDPGPSNSTTRFTGAFNGTSVASASPGIEDDALWVFYQNYEGHLVYSPLGADGSWGSPIRLPTRNGVLNGTSLTAISLKGPFAKIRLFYQDSNGSLRNFRYDRGKPWANLGEWGLKVAIPSTSSLIKRFTYYTDNVNYQYVYYTGTDGLVREFTL